VLTERFAAAAAAATEGSCRRSDATLARLKYTRRYTAPVREAPRGYTPVGRGFTDI